MDAKAIIEKIRTAEKKTPVKAYIRTTRPLHFENCHVFTGADMIVTLYLCSIFGWVLLWQMWTLLNNIRRSEVFIPENIRCLRIVSWCCVAAGAICLVSTLFYIPFAAIAIAAGFMALIVRIVKNVFEQAIRMKDELDYTI